ncbi:MAG TPA: amidohydrolase family protein [Acidimicrobiales bacterium]|nr:amidohydrolase family protein [Acidimicrobiales bacterium]
MPIIDTDSHVTEPRDTWSARMSTRRWGEMVPHVVWDPEAGEEFWHVGDQRLAPVALFTQAGWPERFPSHPRTFAEANPASWDPKARVRALDDLGIWAQAMYPNVGGFGSQVWRDLDPPELGYECVRAYNDMLLDWADEFPGRFIVIAATPYWDVPAAVAEVERVAERGAHGVLFTGAPQAHGQPYLGDHRWDPLWATCRDAGLPVSFHLGSGSLGGSITADRLAVDGINVTYARQSTELFLDNATQLCDLLFSGVLARFPGLQFVSVESGVGWVPFLLEAVDYHFVEGDVAKARAEFEELPSFYYRRQVHACYWFEKIAPRKLLEDVGTDRILFETDFPHPTCLEGTKVADAVANLDGVGEDARRRILWENAVELYGLDLDAIESVLPATLRR